MADLSLLQIAGINGPTYEDFYKDQKINANGEIAAADVAPFLKKFGLSDVILSKVWTVADTKQRGCLCKEEFFLALKMIALVQNNLEPSLANATMSVPSPKLASSIVSPTPSFATGALPAPTSLPSSAAGPTGISSEEWRRYQNAFEQMSPVAGKLSGQQAKTVLMQSNLPVDVLTKLWDLADIDKDGALDMEEFAVAMHLIRRCQDGEPLPHSLPLNLVHTSQKMSLLSSRSLTNMDPLMMSTSSLGSARGSFSVGTLAPEQWIITPEERARFDPLFYAADTDHDGFVSGLEVKPIFLRSGVSQPVLAKIWSLVDVKTSGRLNGEQFALAMYLLQQQQLAPNQELPATLPPHMVPPSLRAEMAALKPLTLHDFGITPESDRVFAEVEAIRKEREEVERACNQLDLQITQRGSEVAAIQHAVEQAQNSRHLLEQQKTEAEAKLAEYRQRKQTMEETLSELRASITQEKKVLEELRTQLASQHSAMRDQEAEAERLRTELNDLQREETNVQEKINANRRRLQAIDSENKHCSGQAEQAQKSLTQMETTLSEIKKVLEQLKAAEDNPDSGLPEPDLERAKMLASASPATTAGSAEGAFSSSLEDVAGGFATADSKKSSHNAFGAFEAAGREDAFATTDPFWSGDPFSASTMPAPKAVGGGADVAFTAFDDFFAKPVSTTVDTKKSGADPFGAAFGDDFGGAATGFGTDPFSGGFGEATVASNDPFGSAFGAPAAPTGGVSAPPRPTQGPPAREKAASGFPTDFDPFGGPAITGSISFDPPKEFSRGGKERDSGVGKHSGRHQHHRNSSNTAGATSAGLVSETDQLRWAKEESERLARVEAEARRKEEEEFQLAIKLSQMESKRQKGKK